MRKQQEQSAPSVAGPPLPSPSGDECNLAKISRPRLSHICPRERLFRQLDEALARTAVHIAAPGGAGKTTLVASYLEARKLPCLWYHVQPEDADIAGFFHYLSLAAHKAAPRHRQPLPQFSFEYLPNLPAFTRRFFRALYGRLKTPFLVVLDDYQEVTADAVFHEVVRDALGELPEGIGAILISRNNPPPALARLRLNQSIALLEWDALRLTPDEAAAIAALQFRGQWVPSPELLEQLLAHSEGWVAGLILLITWARTPDFSPRHLHGLARETVFDYFASELFDMRDATTRDFLLETALLPVMSTAMAEQLTGNAQARSILSELHRSHYFTERRNDAEPVYRYHALFREFLLARGGKTFGPQRLRTLRCRAAALLERAGQVEAAVDLWRQAEAWEALLPLLLRQAPVLAAEGRSQTLENWLRALPTALLEDSPWLLYWLGVCRLAFDSPEARRYFEQAFERFLVGADVAGLYLAWSGVGETLIWEFSSNRLESWVATAEGLLARHPRFPTPEIEVRITATLLSAMVFQLPRHPRLPYWLGRADTLVHDGRLDGNLRISLANPLIYRYLLMGEFAKAGTLVAILKSVAGSAGMAPLTQMLYGVMAAMYHQMRGAHEDCLHSVAAGLEEAHALGIENWDFQFYTQGAISAMKAGDLKETRRFMECMAASLGSARDFDVCTYHYQSAGEALCREDFDQAREYILAALPVAERLGGMMARSGLPMWLAYIAARQGDFDEAAQLLDEGRAYHQRHLDSPLIEFEYRLADAQLAMAGNEGERGLHLLEQALAEGRQKGYVSWPFCLPPLVLPLFLKALEAGIEVDYVQSIIRRHRWVPEQPPLEIEHWPWEIKIYTLGRFAVVRDGAELRFQSKAQNKPLELLKALIALGGRDVHANALVDALWPDAEGDTQKLFEVTLHRLRKLLDCDKALLLSSGKLTLDARHVWVDVWPLERRMARLEALLKAGEKQGVELEQAGDAVLRAYQGHFLARDDEQPWMLATRQRLRSRFIRTVTALGRYWQEADCVDQAESLYRRGIERDPLAEELYRCLMVCYRNGARSSEAAEVFHQCRLALASQLGLAPSAATLAVFRTLP